METMPEIQQAVADFADQKKVTFIGLNLDHDSDESQKIVKAMEKGWDWAQNYLGTDSLAGRTLGISSVPKYFLISPDGKLIASANKWAEIKKQLVDSLENKQN